ncbi:DUF3102 domain-containing protein [Paenibacillus sinopodophylli]|uniref:DUF3102 domain-containing protein n=1 Tax=Paenibacillus sinopodophylli TaxID=1837342 RepID=UPI00110CD471|nr:DUF3102 domain-containing protein [Paenibacillus sinopodophylli]
MSKAVPVQEQAIVPATGSNVIVRNVEVIAAEIRSIDDQARKVVLQSAIDIGQRLHEAKELVAHGEWGAWLKDNVNYSQSTAGNFMKIAVEYKGSPSLASLTYSQAVTLLSVPAEERQAFVEDNKAAEMSTRELKAAIEEKKVLEEKLNQQQAKFDDWAQKQKDQREALHGQYEAEANLRKIQEDKVRELEQEVEKAQKAGDAAETKKLKAELRKAEKATSESAKKLADLEAELKQKEVDLNKTMEERLAVQRQELQQQAVEKEKGLNEQLTKLTQQLERSNNEAFLKAKLQLQQIISQGDVLVKAISEVKEPEEQAKLKSAAGTVIDQLREFFK